MSRRHHDHEEKLEVAELLDDMGVDIIEAGFPIASEGDFAAVNDLAKRAKKAVICGLSRLAEGHRPLRRSDPPAKRNRIHTFLVTLAGATKWKLQKEAGRGLRDGDRAGHPRRGHTDDVEWSAEDGHPTRRTSSALRRGGDQRRGPDDQHPRTRWATPARRMRHALFRDVIASACRISTRQRLRSIAMTIRPGGGQFAGRRAGPGRATDRVHRQRHRRARRQHGALEEIVMAMKAATTCCRIRPESTRRC